MQLPPSFGCLALALIPAPGLQDSHEASDGCPAAVYRGAFDCLHLPVFENREEPEGREIELHVVILPALGDEVAPDPVFLIMGGPGQSAADKAAYFARSMAKVHQHRDLVLVDVRGTGDSNPLDFEIGPEDLLIEVGGTLPLELVERELERLRSRADLTQYTTDNVVDDLDDVREALGYERINLYGGSYGTRVALVYLRRHPEHIRTAVMKGVAPLGFVVGVDFARDAQNSLERLFADCSADPACSGAYGDVEAQFAELMRRLREEPVVVEAQHPIDRSTVEVHVSAEAIALTVRDMLYSAPERSILPGMIARGVEDELDEWGAKILTSRLQQFEQLYEGMALAVLAAEDLPLMSPQAIEASARGTFLETGFVNDLRLAAGRWPHADLEPTFWEPVHSEVPVLMISGELDPVTPPGPAEAATQHLPNSLHLVFPHGSHGDLAFRPCIDEVIEAFYRTGTVDGLDISCVRKSGPMPFEVR